MNKKYWFLLILFFLMPLVFISYSEGAGIHYNYTFESENEGLLTEFNRTSNLRFIETFDTGNFDAEFSFDGFKGLDFRDLVFVDGYEISSNTYGTISDIGGHNDVLQLYDGNNADKILIEHDIDELTFGTISFWFRSSNTDLFSNFKLQDGINAVAVIRIHSDKFEYWDGGYSDVGVAAVDNTWYHLRIDWECTVGGFNNLAQYDWNLFINGDHVGIYDFGNNQPNVDLFTISTGLSSTDYSTYVDAIDIVDDYYNHSNIEGVKIETEVYEPDMYKFHQDGVDDGMPKTGVFTSGTLGWFAEDGQGSLEYRAGYFANPESLDVDSQNGCIRFHTESAADNLYIDRNFGSKPTGEIELKYEFKVNYFPDASAFGMYVFDDDADLILSTFASRTGVPSVLSFYTSNGVDNTIITFLEQSDIVRVRVLFSIQYLVYSVHTIHWDSSAAEYFEYETIWYHSGEEEFYNLKFNMYSETAVATNFYLDNIGIYFEGESLDLYEYGYGEIYHSDLSEFEGTYAFDGYTHVGTCNPTSIITGYIIADDNLVEIFSMADQEGVINLDDCRDSIIFTLKNSQSTELVAYYDAIYLVENGGDHYLGQILRGTELSLYAHFDVVNGRLQGYNVDYNMTTDWIAIVFDINDTATSNYTLVLNDMYKTNWEFNTVFEVVFTDSSVFSYSMDESEPYDVSGSHFVSDFGGPLPNYKFIDYFKFTITCGSESPGTSVLAGLDLIKLHLRPLGFIDLEDLHDTGILAVMIPIMILLLPTFVISSGIENKQKGMGKKSFLPIFILMSTICFATNIIPLWIYFIILLGCGSLLVLSRRFKSV